MRTACFKCGKSYRHVVYDPPRQYRGGFYGYEVIDTTVTDHVEVRYDADGKPYPHFVEQAMPSLIIKEDWIKDCDCTISWTDDDEYCSHCPHCKHVEEYDE